MRKDLETSSKTFDISLFYLQPEIEIYRVITVQLQYKCFVMEVYLISLKVKMNFLGSIMNSAKDEDKSWGQKELIINDISNMQLLKF